MSFVTSDHRRHSGSNDEHSSIPHLTSEQYAHLPAALPCTNYYDIYPEDAGPTGDVVIQCLEEMQMWALVATPVTKEEALQHEGGCIQYITGDPQNPVEYYHFHNSSDYVFGSATYLRRPARGSVVSTPSL
jgi:hypothetical protein